MAGGDARELLEHVRPGRRFVLTTHVHPDGDGIGSEVALARWLRQAGCPVLVVNRDPVPAALAFLDEERAIETYDPARHDAAIRDADVVVMLDNSDPQRLEDMERPVRAARGFKVCIDHHPDPDSLWDLLLVRLDASCTGMVVHELLKSAGVPLDLPIATALYTALSSDTGRFRFGNTTAAGFRMAAELVEAGVCPAELYRQLSERQSEGFLHVFGALLASMETRCEGRVVLLRLPRAVMDRYGVEREDLAEVINQALKLETSRVAALFREIAPSSTKVSLRSKGTLDVNRLARRHGGGGHRNASGIVFGAGLEATMDALLPDLENLALQG